MCVHINIHPYILTFTHNDRYMCIHIYIERERERHEYIMGFGGYPLELKLHSAITCHDWPFFGPSLVGWLMPRNTGKSNFLI